MAKKKNTDPKAAVASGKDDVDAKATEVEERSAEATESTEIEDAEIIEEVSADTSDDASAPEPDSEPEVVQEDTAEVEPVEPLVGDEVASEAKEPELEAPVDPPAPQAPPPAAAPEKRGGAGGMIIGGIIAACIGGGAVYFAGTQTSTEAEPGLAETVEAQAVEIAALTAALEAAQATNTSQEEALAAASAANAAQTEALAALQEALADTSLADDVSANSLELGSLADLLTETRTRLGELEVQPIPEAELPKEVTEAFERQLQDILGTIEGRFNEMQSEQQGVIAGLEADIAARLDIVLGEIDAQMDALKAAQTEAAVIEQQALATANAADARAAIARISVALDKGEGFADQLIELENKGGIAPPEALATVANDGAATLASLQADFPALARQVLDEVSREAASDGSISPFAALLATQLGARSLEPQEGSGPDAVLSRAEAAIKTGDVEATLMEIAALPERGQEIFADWVSSANKLGAALAAAAEISDQLNN